MIIYVKSRKCRGGVNTLGVGVIMGMLLILGGCSGPSGHEGAGGNNGSGGSDGGKEFEGVITYRISYAGRNDSARYGDTMRLYYSKGNIAKVYNGRGLEALRREVFYGESRRYLIQRAASDTLSTYDMADPGHITLVKTKRSSEDIRILGHVCDKMEFEELYERRPYIRMWNSFFYSSDVLKINSGHFKEWNLGQFNTYTREAGAYYLKYETSYQIGTDTTISKRIYTAVNILEQKVDSSIFHADTTLTKPLDL